MAEKPQISDKERLAAYAYQAQSLQQQAQVLQNQLAQLQFAAAEIISTIETLRNLHTAKGDMVIMPIGSGAFVDAKLTGNNKVLVDVGAGVIAERTASAATIILEERLRRTHEAVSRMQQNLAEISRRLALIDDEAKKVMARMQDVRAPKD